MKISKRKELQNIAINHSADIDYSDFVRIYRGCARKPHVADEGVLRAIFHIPANKLGNVAGRLRVGVLETSANDVATEGENLGN